MIKVGAERFEAPEALFKPTLLDVESAGLAELVFEVINSCDMDVRPDLYKHIVLSGGSTMYPGLPSRLEKEMKALYLKNVAKGDREQASRSSSCASRTRRGGSTWSSSAARCWPTS